MINTVPLTTTNDYNNANFDSVLILSTKLDDLQQFKLNELHGILSAHKNANANFENDLTFCVDTSNNRRIIYSPTGTINQDYDDVRVISNASTLAMKKAISIGSKKPLLINCTRNYFEFSDDVSLLAGLQTAYMPLEIREIKNNMHKIEELGFYHENEETAKRLLTIINAIEIGRVLTRDIGGSDPERMAAPKVLEYVQQNFEMSTIKISTIESQEEFKKFYPCFAAVDRAANMVPRHTGRIIKLEYNPPDSQVDTTLFLVGKGITYDTGGADVKYGGIMAGMHRDKCGAAFVAGFFKTLSLLKPKGIRVYGTMCMARNSIGEESYVADELITSRANVRIRVGNTDAEGRMAMCDALCEAKEMALKCENPHIFTIATLTGHVIKCYGENYSAIMSNGLGKKLSIDRNMQDIGSLIGDPFEISTIRPEDYKFVKGKSDCEHLLQCNNQPSSQTPRGHQFPAAFLIKASGLDKHFIDSPNPLAYSHCDIAGSAGSLPENPTGAPLPSFTYKYIVPRIL